MQTVYIDIFFLINFSMDFLALFLSARLLSRKIRLLRLALSALLGGLYACISLVLSFDARLGAWSILVDVLACALMAAISVASRKNLKGIFSFALVFGATSILLGGAMTALFALFNRMGIDKILQGGSNSTDDGISVWLFAVFAIISAMITVLGGRFFKRKAMRREGSIEIVYFKRSVTLPCICDSGNLLREPISQKPCIIVELDALRPILSRELVKSALSGDISALSERDASKVRLIPAQGVSGNGVLIGIRADFVRLDMGRGMTELDAYVAISTENLLLGEIKALVPSDFTLGAA